MRWGNAERLFFRFVIHALRVWRAVAPRWLAIVPHARLYDRRVRGGGQAEEAREHPKEPWSSGDRAG